MSGLLLFFLWIIRVAVRAGSLDYLSETLYFRGRNVGFTGGCSLKTIASIAHPGPLPPRTVRYDTACLYKSVLDQ